MYFRFMNRISTRKNSDKHRTLRSQFVQVGGVLKIHTRPTSIRSYVTPPPVVCENEDEIRTTACPYTPLNTMQWSGHLTAAKTPTDNSTDRTCTQITSMTCTCLNSDGKCSTCNDVNLGAILETSKQILIHIKQVTLWDTTLPPLVQYCILT